MAEVGYLATLVTEFGAFVTGEDTWSPTVLDSGIDRLVYERHGRPRSEALPRRLGT